MICRLWNFLFNFLFIWEEHTDCSGVNRDRKRPGGGLGSLGPPPIPRDSANFVCTSHKCIFCAQIISGTGPHKIFSLRHWPPEIMHRFSWIMHSWKTIFVSIFSMDAGYRIIKTCIRFFNDFPLFLNSTPSAIVHCFSWLTRHLKAIFDYAAGHLFLNILVSFTNFKNF